MTFGIGHSLTSRLGLLDHVQGRFLQEILVHALGALLKTSALPRLRPGSISQDLALLTDWYELGVDLTLASSSMRIFRPIQRCHWLGAFLASTLSNVFALASSPLRACIVPSSCKIHRFFLASTWQPSSLRLGAFLPSTCPWASFLLMSLHRSQSLLLLPHPFRDPGFSKKSDRFCTGGGRMQKQDFRKNAFLKFS